MAEFTARALLEPIITKIVAPSKEEAASIFMKEFEEGKYPSLLNMFAIDGEEATTKLYTLENLTTLGMKKLMKSYNDYIQDANEENRYAEGWYPVCVEEYLNNEFLEEITSEEDVLVFKSDEYYNGQPDQVSYELGVIAARIHPESHGDLLGATMCSFDAEDSMSHIINHLPSFVPNRFIEGFVAELEGDGLEDHIGMVKNAESILAKLLRLVTANV